MVKEFTVGDQSGEYEESGRTMGGILSEASKLMGAKLVDVYLAEIAKDPNLPLGMFVDLADIVSGASRTSHDGLYRAIDTYLKTRHDGPKSTVSDKSAIPRVKGLLATKKIFSKIWSRKDGIGENSGSDSSESLGFANPNEAKSTPSQKGRYSVS